MTPERIDTAGTDPGARVPDAPTVVWFDGLCNLCNGFVDFLIRRDHAGRIRYGALQSPRGAEMARREGLDTQATESVVVVEEGRVLRRSSAALVALRALGGGWRAVGILLAVPRFVRDPVYDLVARHRYRIFGRREVCRVPTADERDRFVT